MSGYKAIVPATGRATTLAENRMQVYSVAGFTEPKLMIEIALAMLAKEAQRISGRKIEGLPKSDWMLRRSDTVLNFEGGAVKVSFLQDSVAVLRSKDWKREIFVELAGDHLDIGMRVYEKLGTFHRRSTEAAATEFLKLFAQKLSILDTDKDPSFAFDIVEMARRYGADPTRTRAVLKGALRYSLLNEFGYDEVSEEFAGLVRMGLQLANGDSSLIGEAAHGAVKGSLEINRYVEALTLLEKYGEQIKRAGLGFDIPLPQKYAGNLGAITLGIEEAIALSGYAYYRERFAESYALKMLHRIKSIDVLESIAEVDAAEIKFRAGSLRRIKQYEQSQFGPADAAKRAGDFAEAVKQARFQIEHLVKMAHGTSGEISESEAAVLSREIDTLLVYKAVSEKLDVYKRLKLTKEEEEALKSGPSIAARYPELMSIKGDKAHMLALAQLEDSLQYLEQARSIARGYLEPSDPVAAQLELMMGNKSRELFRLCVGAGRGSISASPENGAAWAGLALQAAKAWDLGEDAMRVAVNTKIQAIKEQRARIIESRGDPHAIAVLRRDHQRGEYPYAPKDD